jgi:hypothetical protein
VNNTQDLWAFVPRPSFGIIKTKEHNILETGFVPAFRWRAKTLFCWVPWEGHTSTTSLGQVDHVNKDTTQKEKKYPLLWGTQAHRWDQILKIETTKTEHSTFHQQQFQHLRMTILVATCNMTWRKFYRKTCCMGDGQISDILDWQSDSLDFLNTQLVTIFYRSLLHAE